MKLSNAMISTMWWSWVFHISNATWYPATSTQKNPIRWDQMFMVSLWNEKSVKKVSRMDFVFLYPYSMNGLRMHSSTMDAWLPRLYNKARMSLMDSDRSGAAAAAGITCLDFRAMKRLSAYEIPTARSGWTSECKSQRRKWWMTLNGGP